MAAEQFPHEDFSTDSGGFPLATLDLSLDNWTRLSSMDSATTTTEDLITPAWPVVEENHNWLEPPYKRKDEHLQACFPSPPATAAPSTESSNNFGRRWLRDGSDAYIPKAREPYTRPNYSPWQFDSAVSTILESRACNGKDQPLSPIDLLKDIGSVALDLPTTKSPSRNVEISDSSHLEHAQFDGLHTQVSPGGDNKDEPNGKLDVSSAEPSEIDIAGIDPLKRLEQRFSELSASLLKLLDASTEEEDSERSSDTDDYLDLPERGRVDEVLQASDSSLSEATISFADNSRNHGSGESGGSSEGAQNSSACPDASFHDHIQQPTFTRKRSASQAERYNEDDDEDELPSKRPKLSPNSSTSQTSSEQIPCVLDKCPGRDKHLSEFLRKLSSQHSLSICGRCWAYFQNHGELQRHRKLGFACEPHCISQGCETANTMFSSTSNSMRRHRLTEKCVAETTRDKWQYVYSVQYPDRVLPEPVFPRGEPHLHIGAQPRPGRRKKQQPTLDSLPGIQNDIQSEMNALRMQQEQRKHEDELQSLKMKQQQDQIVRLENIITACVEQLTTFGLFTNSLRRMIQHDAPRVFQNDSKDPTAASDPVAITSRITSFPTPPEAEREKGQAGMAPSNGLFVPSNDNNDGGNFAHVYEDGSLMLGYTMPEDITFPDLLNADGI